MSDLSVIGKATLTMSSIEIADLVDSRHDKVKQSIERLANRGVIQLPPMGEVINHLGQRVTEFRVSKRDSYVVVAQLSPEFTAKLVDRWQELEAKQAPALPQTFAEALRVAADLAEQNERIALERDKAIATKAQISSSREASVMGKLSAAAKKVRKLECDLGRNCEQATVTAVEKAIGRKLGKQAFRPLKKWCTENGVTPNKVPCPRYGEVVAWPARAWNDCYLLSLTVIFGE